MIVLGMSVYTYYHSFSFFYESAVSGRFFTPSILCILIGMALMIVTMFGFFGSLKQSTCMVNSYAVILSVILLTKLVVVILAFTTDAEGIMKFIYIPVKDYVTDPEIQAEIDRLQISLNCCGSYSFQDYAQMEFNSNHSTVMVTTDIDGELYVTIVPESCCLSNSDSFCTRVKGTGCKEALVSLVVQNAAVLGVLGVSVMFIKLLGIIFSVLLARCIRKVKSERALISWKIKEQMILARQNEESQKNNDSVYIAHPESSIA
ncbi:CD63 antigen-like isoform X2 [Epargyreus clarus]